jgi:hypothetical protein
MFFDPICNRLQRRVGSRGAARSPVIPPHAYGQSMTADKAHGAELDVTRYCRLSA